MRFVRLAIVSFLFLVLPFRITAKTVSPLDFGLRQALTGEERFEVLFQTHKIAKKRGWKVSYEGIHEIKIDIPLGAKSIQLGEITDFCGVTFMVTNTKTKDFFFI